MINLPKAIDSLPPSPGVEGAAAPRYETNRIWSAVSWLKTVTKLIANKGEEVQEVLGFAESKENYKEAAAALGIDAAALSAISKSLVDAMAEVSPPKKRPAKKVAIKQEDQPDE